MSNTSNASKLSIETKISNQFTVGDWLEMRNPLITDLRGKSNSDEPWKSAWTVLQDRVQTRFISPIEWILEKNHNSGEGFSAVALQCILLEFLAALYGGLVYSTKAKDELFKFEYNSSKKLFLSFIRDQPPFFDYFNTEDKIQSFYNNVRCGLIHQAATKESVLIRKGGPDYPLVEFTDDNPEKMILYRSNFQEALINWLDHFKIELLSSTELKQNFIRKMDDICGIERIIYFAYGSNMLRERLIKRIGKYHTAETATLKGYSFVYNKKSIDGSAKANLQKLEGDKVQGVCYEIDYADFQKLVECEKRYEKTKVTIRYPNSQENKSACTFISNVLTTAPPHPDYVDMVQRGAKHWGIDITLESAL